MNRRHFIRLGAIGSVLYGTNLLSCISPGTRRVDSQVVVIGATPAGIMASIAAARLGNKVALAEYHNHIGGMSTSGLGKSDIENKDAIAGLFKEFTKNIHEYYIKKYGEQSENVRKCKEGYYYEPHVAELIFNRMIEAEKDITLVLNHQIENVLVTADSIQSVSFANRETGETLTLEGEVFIDATYEGDVYALAGAAYSLGREGRTEFDEEHAGHIFFDYQEKTILEGSTGLADKKLPAYTYRLCLTDDPDNSFVMQAPPEDYNRDRYIGYFDDLKAGRLAGPKVIREGHGYYAAHFDTLVRAFSFAEIPNRKYDVNINPRPLGFPFPEENTDYVEATWKQREKVFERHRNLVLGLLYFLQNDQEVPENNRKIAKQYHFPLDEFTDNSHFPWQLYVREARRLKGQYILTENDAMLKTGGTRNTVFYDSIIAGEFPIDSFPVSKQPSPDNKVLEGYIGLLSISPYQIPYRILIPEKIKGLIVAVAVSTSHVAYSTVRMEPLWMGLGQVAGTAASLALTTKTDVGRISINLLQQKLLEYNQILTYFDDVPIGDKAFVAIQYWGTKGFFDSYSARPMEKLTVNECENWIRLYDASHERPVGADFHLTDGYVDTEELDRMFLSAAGRTGKALSFGKKDWLYDRENAEGTVRRGEACMAFYLHYLSTLQA